MKKASWKLPWYVRRQRTVAEWWSEQPECLRSLYSAHELGGIDSVVHGRANDAEDDKQFAGRALMTHKMVGRLLYEEDKNQGCSVELVRQLERRAWHKIDKGLRLVGIDMRAPEAPTYAELLDAVYAALQERFEQSKLLDRAQAKGVA